MKKILLLVSAGIFAICALVYIGGALWFSDHFYPNTVINGTEILKSQIDDVREEYEGFAENYSININERQNKTETISAADIALKFNVEGEIEKVKEIARIDNIPCDGAVITFLDEDVVELIGRKDNKNMFQVAFKFPAGEETTIIEEVDEVVGVRHVGAALNPVETLLDEHALNLVVGSLIGRAVVLFQLGDVHIETQCVHRLLGGFELVRLVEVNLSVGSLDRDNSTHEGVLLHVNHGALGPVALMRHLG